MAISLGSPFDRSRDTKEECESHLWGACVDPAARYMTLTELTAGVPEKLLREIMEVVNVFELRQLVSSAKVKVIWSWTADYSLDLFWCGKFKWFLHLLEKYQPDICWDITVCSVQKKSEAAVARREELVDWVISAVLQKGQALADGGCRWNNILNVFFSSAEFSVMFSSRTFLL